MIPIIISVTYRTEYLPYMLNSLLASKLYGAQIFIHSNHDDPAYNTSIQYTNPLQRELQSLNIPQIHSRLYPYSKYCKIQIAKNPHLHIKKVKDIISYYFDKLDTDFIIYLKDDIIFNEDWLTNLLNLYNILQKNLGFIAGCDLNTLHRNPYYVELDQNIQRGYIQVKTKSQGRYGSSQCYLITRSFAEKWMNTKLSHRIDYHTNYNNASDFILNQACVALGFKSYLTTPQYIQHIGVYTKRPGRKKMLFTQLFKTPFCYGNFLEVKNDFRSETYNCLY